MTEEAEGWKAGRLEGWKVGGLERWVEVEVEGREGCISIEQRR
jgi:hypothetical protein